MECNNSNYWYNYEPVIGTTNQVIWKGGDIPCLDVCDGSRLTTLQAAIIDKLCTLLASADVSGITLPDCFIIAWGTQDKTILNFLNFILQTACEQQKLIDELENEIQNVNPLVTIDYKCCSDNPCVTTGTVTLSEALQNIINCMCTLKEELDDAQTGILAAQAVAQEALTEAQATQNQLNITNQTLLALSTRMNNVECKINCIITNATDSGINTLPELSLSHSCPSCT